MAFSGNWKNSPAALQGEQFRAFTPRENWGTGADERHSERTGHDVWSDMPYSDPTTPQFQEEIPVEIEDSYDVSRIPPTLPSPLDGEPKGHDGINTAPWGVGPWRAQETNNIARETDRGLPRFFQTRETVMRGVTQTYDRGRYPSLPASDNNGGTKAEGQALRAMRGRNALAINNPGSAEGPDTGNYRRQGMEVVAWTNRWMPRRTLTHTKRALHLNLAAVAKPSAAPQGDAYSPYTSPYDGRTTSLSVGTQRGMERREPRPWDEDTRTDGSGSDDSWQYGSWGL